MKSVEEQAGTGKNCFDGREFPWGDFKPGRANIDETSGEDGSHYLARTSAAGIYPQGASPWGCHRYGRERLGVVPEQVREKSSDTDPGEDAWRVVRGGSWVGYRHFARCASRRWSDPGARKNNLGFRVLCVSPIP
jgi:formylglycine-generating enzyme required for sulfatase activity